MRESIHALRCDFLCLQDTQGKRPPRLLLYKRMHIFRSDKKWPTTHSGGSALGLQRSIVRENCSKFLTFIARLVGGILYVTNEHSKSEMTSNRQTDAHTHTLQYPRCACAPRATMTLRRETLDRPRSTKITTRNLADAHAPENDISPCAMDRSRLMLRQNDTPTYARAR